VLQRAYACLSVCLFVLAAAYSMQCVQCACHSACRLHFAQYLISLFRSILQSQKRSFDIIVLTAPVFSVRFLRISFQTPSLLSTCLIVSCSSRLTMLERDIVKSHSFCPSVCLSVCRLSYSCLVSSHDLTIQVIETLFTAYDRATFVVS